MQLTCWIGSGHNLGKFLHESCWYISQLVVGKISSQLDLSTLSYGHCSFGYSAEIDCKSPELGQAFGALGLVLWA